METPVCRELACHVAFHGGCPAGIGCRLEGVQVVLGRTPHPSSQRIGLEQLAQPVDLFQLGEIELRDRVPAPRAIRHETLAGEGP